MNIFRRGSQRNRGWKSVLSGLQLKTGNKYVWEDNVRWDSKSKHILINAYSIPHGDGITSHNYQIQLSLDDVTALVILLGHAGSASDAALLRERLAKHVPALVKLLACATGLSPTPIAEDVEKESP